MTFALFAAADERQNSTLTVISAPAVVGWPVVAIPSCARRSAAYGCPQCLQGSGRRQWVADVAGRPEADAIGHQGGKMGLQFVQLRVVDRQRDGQPTPVSMRSQAMHRNLGSGTVTCAKRRRYAMAPPVLQMAFSAAGRAARPLPPVAVGLRRNEPLVETLARSLLLASGKVNPRSAISPRPSGRQISIRSVRQTAGISHSVAINLNTHRIPVPPVGYRPDRSPYSPRVVMLPPFSWTRPVHQVLAASTPSREC